MSQGNIGLQSPSPPTMSNNSTNSRSPGRGLIPTDGQDAFKRSASGRTNDKSTRRSRAERTSYLLATGHLDFEETKHLTSETSHDLVNSRGTTRNHPPPPQNVRGKFQQTTYTEVNLPMKTSPAFEYILKKDRRRNRRCFLWILYFVLVSLCLALIGFSIVQLLR